MESIESLETKIKQLYHSLSIEKRLEEKTLIEANQKTEWDESLIAEQKKLAYINHIINSWNRLNNEIELIKEYILYGDQSDTNLENEIKDLYKKILDFQIESTFNEEDDQPAILEIHSGTGGTEAQDWANMLKNMYIGWSLQEQRPIEIMDSIPGEEAGIRSCCLKIGGKFAYGLLKNETGVHRLVRISPFNAQSKRQTSFAAVEVYSFSDNSIKIDIDQKDLRIDTYRSSGAGGQHVNKTESAVRITHIPSGIVVQCQDERSQHSNKASAMEKLKLKLLNLEKKKKEIEKRGSIVRSGISWGEQARSYVLQPYQLIKDHRTNFSSVNTLSFLKGEIREILEHNAMFFHKDVV